MSRESWFKRLIPRPVTPPAVSRRSRPRVIDVDLYRGLDGGDDWTAEWGPLDEPAVDEITTGDLAALVEHVLADARNRWGQGERPDLTVQWSLHDEDDTTTDVTGTAVGDVVMPLTLNP